MDMDSITCPISGAEIIAILRSLSGQPSRFLTEFEEIEVLGSGGYGIVSRCLNKLDDVPYAVKKIPIGYLAVDSEEDGEASKAASKSHKDSLRFSNLIKEVQCLAKINHPHILKYYSTWVELSLEGLDIDLQNENRDDYFERAKNSGSPCLYVQTQLCNNTLKELMDGDDLSDTDILVKMSQIVDGLTYLHDKGMVHMDLTADNLYVDDESSVRIGDFGLARYIGEDCPSTDKLMYKPPEGEIANEKYDIYFLGMVLFEMLSGFKSRTERIKTWDKLKLVGVDEFVSNWEVNDNLKTLMVQMIAKEPENRPSASELKDRLQRMLG